LPPEAESVPVGLYTNLVTPALSDAVIRLAECLLSPVDSRMLGRLTVREIVYRVLRGEQGAGLRALANRGEHYTRIARVLRYMHGDYAKEFTNEDLAKRAGMSVSMFHHNFKLVTAT
jgi:transcriptional regulator GlxA family with amidase domain